MESATIPTKGQLAMPSRLRMALRLLTRDKVLLSLEGDKLVLQRRAHKSARLVQKKGRKGLVAPPDARPMTSETVKALLAEFP